MISFENIFYGKTILITGHNGFKGTWLSLWLNKLGANVIGVSLPEDEGNHHFSQLNVDVKEYFCDIRNVDGLRKIFLESQPEAVFHLAAQSLVRPSYKDPLETWSTNVMGTANVLEMCRLTDTVKAVLIVTSDKCYENREWRWGYREVDRLGGHDPYSASKACCELVTKSYRDAFPHDRTAGLIASARAGNVIGGGDWAVDRLIPDVMRAIRNNEEMIIRSPHSTRPWQHVLEPLSGYLMLVKKLLEGQVEYSAAWNFGPGDQSNRTVLEVVEQLNLNFPTLKLAINENENEKVHEAGLLKLDSSKSNDILLWKSVWGWQSALEYTANWYISNFSNSSSISSDQIEAYTKDALNAKSSWVCE